LAHEATMYHTGKMSKKSNMRISRINFRLPESLREAIQQEAARERRTMSDMAVLLLTDALAARYGQARKAA
jgi:uncharacterized protein (DUF1778 family)